MLVINTPPSSLMDSTTSPKMKTTKGKGVGACFLTCNILGVEGRACWSSGMETKKIDEQINYSHGLAQTKQQVDNVYLKHFWCKDKS